MATEKRKMDESQTSDREVIRAKTPVKMVTAEE